MAHGKKDSLVHRPGTGLAGQERRTSPVIARMTRDVLARAAAHGLSQARFRIGEHLLREPDYRQILSWAEALEERFAEIRRLARGVSRVRMAFRQHAKLERMMTEERGQRIQPDASHKILTGVFSND